LRLAEKKNQVSKGDEPVPEKINLKIGAQVIAMTNGKGYQNGSIGVVTDFIEDDNEDSVVVQFNSQSTPIVVHPHTWSIYAYLKFEGHYQKVQIGEYSQIPLRLGYAITIHKAQGQTYKRVSVQPAGWACMSRYQE
jgi:tetratricopeptide repeat protein